jgi:phosphatidylserine synthase
MMRHTHIQTGGRYPVLRALAILYLVGACIPLVFGVWRAAYVLMYGHSPEDFFGAPTGWAGRIIVAASWLAASFLSVLFMVAVAELIKLFVDIEHNTRMSATRFAPASAPASTEATTPPALSGDSRLGGRLQWLEGEETAEGALIRGH